jgi:hypothetical protein
MGEARSCPTCGTALPAGAQEGFCACCRPPGEESTIPGPPGDKGGGDGRAGRGRLRNDAQGCLLLLPISMIGSALCVLVGVGIAVYAALAVPLGTSEFWGCVGSALGSFFGGVTNWKGTTKRCREVDEAQGLLLDEMARMYASLVPGKDRQGQARLLFQEPGWTWLDRRNLGRGVLFVAVFGLGVLGLITAILYKAEGWVIWVSALSLVLVVLGLVGFFGFSLKAFVYLVGRLLLRRSGSQESGAGLAVTLKPGTIPAGVAPQVMMLGFGAVCAFMAILIGVIRMQAGLGTHADCTGAFWGGVEVSLGALLGGGTALLARQNRAWKWKGWETVMEDPQWNWFDNVTVAWLVLAVLTWAAVLSVSRMLPWPAANAVQHLGAIFGIKGVLFFMVRRQFQESIRQKKTP